MQKATKGQINLLIMLIGVLLAVASYFFVFTKFNERRAALANENAALQAEVDALQELADNKEFYISETERMDKEIGETIQRYPADVLEEDEVMYTAAIQGSNQMWVNGLTIAEKQQVMVAGPAPVEAAPVEDADAIDAEEAPAEEAPATTEAAAPAAGLANTVFLYTSPFTLSYKSTYTSIKDVITSIVTSDDRMSIKNVTIGYDAETGVLSGTVDATMYTMEGTGTEYISPTVNGVPTGTPDIFRSGTILNLGASRPTSTGTEGGGDEGADSSEAPAETTESNN